MRVGAASPLLAPQVVDVNAYRTGQSWHIRGAIFTFGVWASLVGLFVRIVIEIVQAADDVIYEWGAIDILWFLPIGTYLAYLIEGMCCSSTRKFVSNAGDENASETVVARMKCSAPRFTMHVRVSTKYLYCMAHSSSPRAPASRYSRTAHSLPALRC